MDKTKCLFPLSSSSSFSVNEREKILCSKRREKKSPLEHPSAFDSECVKSKLSLSALRTAEDRDVDHFHFQIAMEHHQIISLVYRVTALTFFLLVYIVGLIGNGLLICK